VDGGGGRNGGNALGAEKKGRKKVKQQQGQEKPEGLGEILLGGKQEGSIGKRGGNKRLSVLGMARKGKRRKGSACGCLFPTLTEERGGEGKARQRDNIAREKVQREKKEEEWPGRTIFRGKPRRSGKRSNASGQS